MYDLSVINSKPGPCEKCRGSGLYCWGGTVNGKPKFTGRCHSCRGSGRQSRSDMRRNGIYNTHKIARIIAS